MTVAELLGMDKPWGTYSDEDIKTATVKFANMLPEEYRAKYLSSVEQSWFRVTDMERILDDSADRLERVIVSGAFTWGIESDYDYWAELHRALLDGRVKLNRDSLKEIPLVSRKLKL